jgi:hypothetical protein
MTDEDKSDWSEMRPFIVGIVALAFKLRRNVEYASDCDQDQTLVCFDRAERFVDQFEIRNKLK